MGMQLYREIVTVNSTYVQPLNSYTDGCERPVPTILRGLDAQGETILKTSIGLDSPVSHIRDPCTRLYLGHHIHVCS